MKKRDKIIISIIIIVALIAALVVLLFYLNSRNIIKIGNDNKTKQDEQIQEEVSIVQKQAKEKYPSFKWVSDGNIAKVEVSIEDGKVILNNGTKTDVKFDKGTPKYASAVINGGVLKEIFVITTDGALYITKSDVTGYNAGDKFEIVNLGEKVIDATYADGTDMYYLLENGKLVTKDLKEYVAFETKALEIQKQAKEKYPSFKWVSDGNITKIEVSIEDGKVILNNGTKTDVKFDKGTPKYASAVINGGVLKEIFVITTDGALYITKSDVTGYNAGDKFEIVNLGEKVIDATYADGTDMYYLLENGKLVTKDLKEYVAFETKALEIQKQAKEKYPSFKWVSDGNITKIEVSIEDGKVILNNGTKTDVKFDKGTPKYASAVINGGVLKEIFVITTDGALYITKSDITGYNVGDKFEFVNLGKKVIDATYADGTDMYYLLEDGTIVNSNGMLK
ncbi:MAG: hypothetical protein ACLTON_04750 [Christensenellales bacterium]